MPNTPCRIIGTLRDDTGREFAVNGLISFIDQVEFNGQALNNPTSMQFEIADTIEMRLLGSGLTVTDLVIAKSLRASGDGGGGVGTFTITDNTDTKSGTRINFESATGGESTLSFIKGYTGTTVCKIPILT